MGTEEMATILIYILIAMIVLLFALSGIYIILKLKSKDKEVTNESKSDKTNKNSENAKATEGNKQSVLNFMEFDKIEDNMILQKDGKRYLMVVKCQGVNYDLMSGMEKVGVEQGFIQFLNTLRHPIQLYIQTRTVSMTDSIENYNAQVKRIEEKLSKMRQKYSMMMESDKYTKEQKDRYFFEITKQTNLYEYGKDIIANTERMSLNKNVLVNSYYIIIPYYPEEANNSNLGKEEIKSIAFSELYARAQSIIGTLYACSVNAKIMNSDELAELLYVAYNRDGAEVFGIDKAIRAGYDELYSTAPDVLDKKMKELDRVIEERASELANNTVLEVKSEKQLDVEEKEDSIEELVKKLAASIVKENERYIGEDIAEKAVEKINKRKGGKNNVQE